ncbi:MULTISPECIES: LamG-like jellyroll fold domain-containing protein [unclassified Flavobacterium]|uniref:LamG-like jellyroll fold domain-containing protein n=1 Tax=unclassified Flavobacterium TaxID=196869 RepID=UPI001F1304C3|nr:MULTISPECIES: LamG-like jellyroll fold domain-containing protein [unclassified Flavobacterium]UMY66901.1 fibronectin type III domain-containing protein [Flavobacterium sp. HJ-32-4]
MKRLLLSLFLFCTAWLFAQPTLSSVSVTNVTGTSAVVNYYAAANCTQGAAVEIIYSTTLNFANYTTVPSISVFAGQNFSVTIQNLIPETQYFLRVRSYTGSACGNQQTQSSVYPFLTLADPQLPQIQGVTVALTGTATGSVNYSLKANGLATTSVLRWGTAPGELTNQATGASAVGYLWSAGSANMTGLALDTTYYYQIAATNSLGTTESPIYSVFNGAPQETYEYSFDNTYATTLGTFPFTPGSGIGFTAGHDGTPNGALALNNVGTSAMIPNLPYGDSPRSFSFWVKLNTFNSSGYNHVYSYGQAAPSAANGGSIGPSLAYHLGYANNHSATIPQMVAATWYHFTMVYDGTTSRIYRNGVLVGTQLKTWNTVSNNNLLSLGVFAGEFTFNGAIDDFRVFRSAITDADAESLYVNGTLAVPGIAAAPEIAFYPNPVSDVLYVDSEDALSVTVYALNGQKIASTFGNRIEATSWAPGVYLVRAEDAGGHVTTRKIVKR